MKRAILILFLLGSLFFTVQRTLAQAVITPGQVIGQITACQGAESENQEYEYFTLLGFNLTGTINAAATSGFLVSTSVNTGFKTNITITPRKGTVIDTVYIRLGPSNSPGNVTGIVALTSAGLAPQTVAVSGTVLNMPTADPEPNITVLNGTSLPRLNFEGTGNMYSWTSSNPNIGLAASGIDSLPAFRVLSNSNTTVTDTVTVTPVLAGTAYVTNTLSGAVSVINTLTNTLDTTITAGGRGPASEILSPDGSKLYVLNTVSLTISVINTLTNKLANLFYIPLKPDFPNYPYQIALNHDGSQIYLINWGAGTIFILNAQTGALISELSAGGIFTSEIAFSASGNLFYVGTNNGVPGALNVFNAGGNTQTFSIPVPAYPGVPKAPPPFPYINMVFSPDSTRLYTANGSAVTVVNTQTQKAIATLPTGYAGMGNAIALAISPDGKTLYALVNGIGTINMVQIFDTATNAAVGYADISQGVPTGLCISPDGSYLYVSLTGTNTVAVINTQTSQIVANIPVGNMPEINAFCIKPGGCFGNPISFIITVNPGPVPVIVSSADTLAALTTTYGTPSASESFTVSGSLLRAGILVTPPPGFEVSLDNTNFSNAVTINGPATIPATTVYIRLAAADIVAGYTGHVVLSSVGAGNNNVEILKSTVTPASLIITADNKFKVFGAPNPPLTASFQGFENNDTAAELVFPPALSTTAVTSSPVGRYPITVGDAYSPNYTISYLQGALTITPDVIIPNTFTPNGDGINDMWNIQKINDYPNCTVQVFSRYGEMVFQSSGYGSPWNGTYKGSPLPEGTYYYIINLNAGVPLLSGFVAIIR